MARWQSGDAADCKSVYAGSIPTRASISDEEGYFSLERGDNDAGAVLVSKGGTDTRTGNLLSGVFISDVSGDPSAPQIISAISTLLSSLEVESDKTRLLEAIGFDGESDAFISLDFLGPVSCGR